MIAATWRSLENGDYPIITLEWRRMMRGKLRFRVALIAAAAISVLGLFGAFAEAAGSASGTVSRFGALPLLAAAAIVLLALFQQAVLWLVIPLYTARSIAAQREAGSLHMLAVTPMRSGLVVGQIMAVAMGYALAAAAVSLPSLVAVCVQRRYLQIGALLPPFAGGLAEQIAFPMTAAFYASIGILCSCTYGRSQTAVFVTYVGMVVVGRALLAALWLFPAWLGLRPHVAPASLVVPAALAVSPAVSVVMAVLFTWMAINRLDRLRRGLGGAAW